MSNDEPPPAPIETSEATDPPRSSGPDRDPDTSASASAGRVPFTWRTAAWVFPLFLVVSGLFNVLVIKKLPGISPVDGIVYADALDRALDSQVTVRGDSMGEATTAYIACRGVEGFGTFDMACGGPYSDQFRGLTTAYLHAPTYFFATAAVVHGVQLVAPDVYEFDAARLAGALWFSLGALLFVWLATLWGAPARIAVLIMLAYLPTPVGVLMFSFITPDAMSLLVASAVLLGVSLWWRQRIPAWTLLLFGVLVGTVKQTFVLAAVAGVLLIALLWLRQRGTRPTRDFVTAGVALTAGAAIGVLGWDLIKRSLATVSEEVSTRGGDPFAVPLDVNGVLSLVFTAAGKFPEEALGQLLFIAPGAQAMGVGLGLAVTAAAGGALLYRSTRSDVFVLAAAAVLVMLLGSLLLSSLDLVSRGVFLPPAVRYVIGGVPLLLLPLAMVSRRRAVSVLLVFIAVGAYAAWFAKATVL